MEGGKFLMISCHITRVLLLAMGLSRPFINILVSSTVMCLVYTAFFPGVGIQEAVLEDSEEKLGTIVGFLSQGRYMLILLLSHMTILNAE